MERAYHPTRAIALWVLICSFLTCAGWLLSVAHHLDKTGYSIAFLVGEIALAVAWKTKAITTPRFNLKKLRRRFSRGFPLVFLVLALIEFAGGFIYAPTNYDALSYRLPRILHWLAAGQWHWVHTDFQRLNTRSCGIEWVSAPLMLFFKNDRLLFLINVISFLMMPGLVFSFFTKLGIRARTMWYWMWIVPAGYCFLLQAGSIGNDMFGAIWALAAMDFAMRASLNRRVTDLWLAFLAAALVTGSKTSNLPILLPIAIALFPAFPLIKHRHRITTFAVVIFAGWVSFLPLAALNLKNCGDWSGQKAEQGLWMGAGPGLHIAQNCVLVIEQNLAPPIFPIAKQWNAAVLKIMPAGLRAKLEAAYEPGGAHLALGELQIEEDAGIGLGVSGLLLITFAATVFSRPKAVAVPFNSVILYQRAVLIAGILSLGPFLWVSGLTAAGRLLTPYYCLVVPAFLLWQSGDWIRKNAWWRYLGYLTFVLAAMLVILSPARPLWPAHAILADSGDKKSPLMQRASAVYSVYADRPQAFAPAVQALPDDLNVLGLVALDFPETSLWIPYGSRRIEHVLPDDTLEYFHQRGIGYILINPLDYDLRFHKPFDQWLAEHHAEVYRTIPMTLRLSTGKLDWQLVHIKD